MDAFEDSDRDETGTEDETTAATLTHGREAHEMMELQELEEHYEEEGESGSEEEAEDDMAPMVRPHSQLATLQEAEVEVEEEEEEAEEEEEEEEEEDEEGEEAGTMGAEVWEEGEGETWEEDELSPADMMMTEEEARMLAAPLDEDSPPNPLLF